MQAVSFSVIMAKEMDFRSTADIKVSKGIIDQVIGQEDSVQIIKKAAKQRRHVFLIGEPGTGKSMLGLALAELLPKEKLMDTVSFANPNDENQPLIRTLPAGKGRELTLKAKMESMGLFRGPNSIFLIFAVIFFILSFFLRGYYISQSQESIAALGVGGDSLAQTAGYSVIAGTLMYSLTLFGGIIFIGILVLLLTFNKKGGDKTRLPKLIVDNYNKKQAPFFDATGAHAGALLGDVLHDPFQSGGLGTPAHERVVAGMIHKAHMGVLFIDEIATLQPHTQQELLTALQEGKYSITGQSERSAGAMVRTEAVPCNFILVAAGNLETIKNMHPALRSRIRGYGYETYMKETMEDTQANRQKIAQFVAQEVTKDKKIPHFTKDGVLEIIDIAKKMANRKGHLTLRLRELGGLVRASGDIATEEKAKLVERKHIVKARKVARTLEQQIADRFIERKKEYDVITLSGKQIGRVNGLAVMGAGSALSGIILPIESEVTPGGKESEIIATGKLGEIAKEAVINVSAIVKRFFGTDIKETYDIYVQFLQTYEGVEGDSASIAVAISVISAFKQIPIKQNFAMTGSLSVRGKVLPVGGVSSKVEAAIEAGIEKVIVPESNLNDIVIGKSKLSKIELIPVNHIVDVLEVVMDWKGQEDVLASIKKAAKSSQFLKKK